jgi:hypothetical protein
MCPIAARTGIASAEPRRLLRTRCTAHRPEALPI